MIIQPDSRLPFKQVLSKNKKKYQIRDADNILVVDNVYDMSDALFIQDACNHFNEAVGLLRNLASLPDSKVYNFLKKIENE